MGKHRVKKTDQLEPLIPKHGGDRKLKSFQNAQLIYDIDWRYGGAFGRQIAAQAAAFEAEGDFTERLRRVRTNRRRGR